MDSKAAGRMSAEPAGTLRTLLRLGRVSNLPTVWSNCLGAAGLASAQPDWRLWVFGAVSMSLIYTGGMFLNDAFDQQHDTKFAPNRPIVAGAIGGSVVYALGFLQLGLGVLGTTLPAAFLGLDVDLMAIVSTFALCCLVVLYNAWHKGNPASPLLMAACRALVYVTIGLLTSQSAPEPLLWVGALALALYVVALTGLGKLESRGLRLHVPGGFATLIAGIALVDAGLLCVAGRFDWALLAALGFPATLGLQRWVRGT